MIEYPKKTSETELEALLWQELKGLGIDARLQVTAFSDGLNDLTKQPEKQKSRLDIVVFKNRKPICIIECKSWSKSYIRNRRYQKAKNTKQLIRYREIFKLPTFICGCYSAIKPLSKIILSVYNKASN